MSGRRDQSSLRAAATSLPSRRILSDHRPPPHARILFSAQAASWSAWQALQAFGEPSSRVAAGAGGRIEWSLRRMRANSVIGMWQSVQRVPGPSPTWWVWAAAAAMPSTG